ncbi:imidazolonepropionase-like domain-containing protein [Streptomyces tagetis]|uniref:Aminodeoxyfutalosine deaminase/Imidazolonepropionase-like composite domain-containing protein n=1 Tax=Streptomyces tagetis TaxID=2820809 RepID=A0A940XJW9_9ACTN|nr:hypothetical protein [Streptomyces sp. RG38]MBQ0828817.1 hypothetical protein [Streptomyces sp. RG38]
MLTIHAADLLLTGDRRPSLPGGAVLVDGRTLAATGPYEELAAAHPAARARRWPGVLMPGLLHPYGPLVLEGAYHPDPREADELGTEPLTGERLAALPMTETRWGAGARRGVRLLLAHGVVAVAGRPRRPAVLDAVQRAGLTVVDRPGRPDGPDGPGSPGRPDGFVGFDVLAGRDPAEVVHRPLPAPGTGADATFAVFDVPDEAALTVRGAATCVATVLAGRLLHRDR